MPGIEPGASYMQSMRSTTELHPRLSCAQFAKIQWKRINDILIQMLIFL